MLKEIPMSRSAFGLGFTVLNIFVGIPSILVGASIVRWGIRKTFGIGSALILAGALWLSLITSRPWHYWVGFGILAAMGISFGTIIPATTAITRWFSRYRGRTMAVTLSASGFAGFFVAPTINRILTGNGGNWRQAWAIVAAVSVLSAIVAFLFVRERPEDLGQMVDGGPDAAPSADSTSASARVTKFPWEPHQAYRTRAYWMILIGAILYGTGFGWTFICFNTVTGHYYGPLAFPKVSGMMLLVAAFFCSPAGYLGGKLFDLWQSYKIAFEINSALAAIGIGALFFARMPEPPRVDILAHETGQLK